MPAPNPTLLKRAAGNFSASGSTSVLPSCVSDTVSGAAAMRVDEEEDTEECVVMLYWQCGESLGLRINNDSNGVTFVKEGGPASRADIRLGDVLVVVGLRSVSGYGSAAQLLNHLLANKRFQSTTICLKRVGSADACASSSYTGDVGDEEEGEEEGVEDQQEQGWGGREGDQPQPHQQYTHAATPPHAHPNPTLMWTFTLELRLL